MGGIDQVFDAWQPREGLISKWVNAVPKLRILYIRTVFGYSSLTLQIHSS